MPNSETELLNSSEVKTSKLQPEQRGMGEIWTGSILSKGSIPSAATSAILSVCSFITIMNQVPMKYIVFAAIKQCAGAWFVLSRLDWVGLVGYFGLGAGTKIVRPVDYYGKDITVAVTVWLFSIQKNA